MNQAEKLKDTLNLPQTDFPMRANAVEREPMRIGHWADSKLYHRLQEKRKSGKSFVLHDGPPFTNGDVHVGTALNKILKDSILRYKSVRGFRTPYVPGWDCHGLPIEHKVTKALRKEKKDFDSLTLRTACKDFSNSFIETQRKQFQRLGVLADWENEYRTMNGSYEGEILKTFASFVDQGLVYRSKKPVYWSIPCRTALAEAEIEYQDHVSPSIFVRFPLMGKSPNSFIVIWTTTPWTLPANLAIAVHPREKYVELKIGENSYWVAASLAESVCSACSLKGITKGESLTGEEMVGWVARHPFIERDSPILAAEYVTMDSGTGCVHTAPGHGLDDYLTGQANGLETYCPLDDNGCYVNDGEIPEELIGISVLEKASGCPANEAVLQILKGSGDLLALTDHNHQYPHCWRSKTPVVFRAMDQWFVSLDHEDLRRKALQEVEEVRFTPEWGKNRIKGFLEARPDWCISRQRSWGVPIAFFRIKSTKEVIFDANVLEHIASLFDAQGADAWYSMSIEDLLPANSGYNADDLEKIDDILDVWFDSGSTWNSVLSSGNYDAGEYPASLYIEGSDQHRGWFQSSLLLSAAVNEVSPYKTLITHGFTVDDKGEKMSKSKGNVVSPDKVIKEYGSEILRLWVALSDYQSDLKISDGILKQTAEQYRKIRNTFRFLLANVDDLEAYVSNDAYGELDRWILAKAADVFASVKSSFDAYDFLRGFSTLNHFITNELSGIYMDITKDRLYCEDKNDPVRRATQSAMAHISKAMLGIVAPVLTYTVDEILEYAPPLFKADMENVFDLVYVEVPKVEASFDDTVLLEARVKFSEAVDKLKKEKLMKSTLEVEIAGDMSAFAINDSKDLEDWFVVSAMKSSSEGEQVASFEIDGSTYTVHKATASKCPRCWRFTSTSEECACERCAKVVV